MVSRTTATAEARCRVAPQRCLVRSARHIGPAATEEVDGSRRRAAPGLGDLAAQAVSRRQPVPAARAPAGPSLTAGSPATRSRQPHGYARTPGTTRMPVNPAARHNRMICTQTTERSMPPTRANTRRSGAWPPCKFVTIRDWRCSAPGREIRRSGRWLQPRRPSARDTDLVVLRTAAGAAAGLRRGSGLVRVSGDRGCGRAMGSGHGDSGPRPGRALGLVSAVFRFCPQACLKDTLAVKAVEVGDACDW